MIYFPEHNLAFFHIHKTGGTSFKQALQCLFPECIELSPSPHASLSLYFRKLTEMGVRADDVQILTVIRDPLAHIVSIYHYWRQSGDPEIDSVQAAKRLTFSDFVADYFNRLPEGKGYIEPLSVDGQIPSNVHLLRLEQWRADLDRLNYPWGPRLQLPHLNASSHEPPSTYHDEQTIRLTRRRYAWVYDSGLYPEPAGLASPRDIR